MKLKLRAEPKDWIIFGIFSVVLLYFVAIAVLNLSSFAKDGTLAGINPFPAFTKDYIGATLLGFIAALAAIFTSVSSYFFDREKGIGISTDPKKEDSYSRWATDKEIKKASKVEQVLFIDKESKYGGVPLMYDKKSAYVDNGESHTLVLGATGSGKTAGVINPTIKMLMKARESIIVSDPKGEIYEDNSGLLRELGYNIIILNFREPQKGNCWNPYHLPYKFQKEGNFDKANELLSDLAANIVIDGKGDDPFWQESAASYLTGLSLALFVDAKTEEEININSVNLMVTTGEDRFGPSTYLKEYFKAKDPASSACVNALGTVNAPNETKGSIVSMLQSKLKVLAVTKNLSEMLSKNDFEMDSIGEKPTAVFMIIQDEKTTYHSLATIFVKQCYESLISVAHKHGGALPVRVNFLLDEFANMPKFKDITTMVTAARSRKIRFLFILQNFAQIKDKYGDHDAETIRGNCANLIYLLTGELAALEEISKLCGDKLIKVGKDKKEETRPLITVSELQRMKQDEMILLKHRCPPYKGKLKMDFETDFGFGKGTDHYGKNVIFPERDMTPIKTFDIKAFVQEQKEKETNAILNGESSSTSPFGGRPIGGSPFGDNGASNPMEALFGPSNNGEQPNIDDIVKRIDAKIAEMEAEEEEENKNKTDNSVNITYNSLEPNITDEEPEIIEEPEENQKGSDRNYITDDQFFDDFFNDDE